MLISPEPALGCARFLFKLQQRRKAGAGERVDFDTGEPRINQCLIDREQGSAPVRREGAHAIAAPTVGGFGEKLQTDRLGCQPLRQERAGLLIAPVLNPGKSEHPSVLQDQLAACADLPQADRLSLGAAAEGTGWIDQEAKGQEAEGEGLHERSGVETQRS